MIRKLGLAMLCVAFLAGCGGRTPNPVMVTQYGDATKSCQTLLFEMQNAQTEMQRLLPKTSKTGKNVALGVAGYFLIVPWFFMDFSDAEQQEYNALRQRYNYLATIAMDRKCGNDFELIPSLEEMKKKYEEEKNTKEGKSAYPGAKNSNERVLSGIEWQIFIVIGRSSTKTLTSG